MVPLPSQKPGTFLSPLTSSSPVRLSLHTPPAHRTAIGSTALQLGLRPPQTAVGSRSDVGSGNEDLPPGTTATLNSSSPSAEPSSPRQTQHVGTIPFARRTTPPFLNRRCLQLRRLSAAAALNCFHDKTCISLEPGRHSGATTQQRPPLFVFPNCTPGTSQWPGPPGSGTVRG